MRLVGAELLKIHTAPRTMLGLVVGLLAIVALGSASAASSGRSSPIASEMAAWDVLEVAATAAFFTLILGILIVTSEYRHGTITPTFLITPRRERVVGAKIVVAAAVAAALAILSIALAVVTALFWIDLDIQTGQWELMARLVYGALAWAVIGVGLGAAIQSQLGAIMLAFVWFLIAERLIGAGIDDFFGTGVSQFFPGGALGRLVSTETVTVNEFGQDDRLFGVWGAAALVTGYAAIAAVAGAVVAGRRDVS